MRSRPTPTLYDCHHHTVRRLPVVSAKVMTRVCLHRQLTSMMTWYWRILSNDTSKQLAVTNRNPAVSYQQHLIRYQY